MNRVTEAISLARWALWEWASWIAWWLCPDKRALAAVQKHGTIATRAVLDQLKRERAEQEAKP